jgi:hypothetical protein
MMEYTAEHGFGLTMTCRRDQSPKDIPGKYFHEAKTNSNARPKAARFEHPIFMMKNLRNDLTDNNKVTGSLQHTSIQSTSSCNITSVNALDSLTVACCTVYQRSKGERRQQETVLGY